MQPFRVEPRLPAKVFRTYAISTPIEDSYRSATCQEVECPNYLNGWVINADLSTARGQKQAHLIEKLDKKYTTHKGYMIDQNGVAKEAPTYTAYVFEAGQSCWNPHRVRTQKPEVYTVRDGDHRDLGNQRIHTRPEDWVDDLQNNQQALIERHERG